MDAVLRAIAVYVVLLLVFRFAGTRTLAQMTSFDFVLLLIISEATQNAMIGDDFSITNGLLVVLTLVGLDILFSIWKQRSPAIDKWLDGLPMIIVENGRPLKDRMNQARVDEQDILQAARERRGLERMDQIKYAGRSAAASRSSPERSAPPNLADEHADIYRAAAHRVVKNLTKAV